MAKVIQAKGTIQMVEIVDVSETRQDRLVKLRKLLLTEIQSDMPSTKYIEDLQDTIQSLEGRG